MSAGTVIIGGGVGGLRCAERLRRKGYGDPIRIVSNEEGLPYDRPHLSKSAITDADAPQPQLLTSPEKLTESQIEIVLGRATSLDRDARTVTLDGGDTLDYEYLVIAAGAEPLRIPLFDEVKNAYTLRRWKDALLLRDAVRQGGRVVIVGAGVLGLEVAASARSLGCEVEVIDLASYPASRLGGPDFGADIAELHRLNGVSLRLGVSIDDAEIVNERVRSVTLSDGTLLAADAVVLAVGARPDLRWLEVSGLVSDGVLQCDEECLTNDGQVYAIGDVATIRQADGKYQRHEHFTNAVDTAGLAATKIVERALGEPQRILDEIPYFWTDQFGVKIQILGSINPDEVLHTVIDEKESQRRLQLSSRSGQVTGVVTWNMPGALNRCRMPLMRGVMTDELLEAEPWVRSTK